MADGGHPRMRRVVKPSPTRSEELERFAAGVRAQPPGDYLDAAEIAGEFQTPDAAKSFAYRVNHGRAAAFRPVGDYEAVTEGNQVSVTYTGRRPALRAS